MKDRNQGWFPIADDGLTFALYVYRYDDEDGLPNGKPIGTLVWVSGDHGDQVVFVPHKLVPAEPGINRGFGGKEGKLPTRGRYKRRGRSV